MRPNMSSIKIRLVLISFLSVAVVLTCLVAWHRRSTAAKYVQVIDRAIVTGESPQQWEQQLEATLWWFPSHSQAWLQRGYLLAKEERFSEAAEALRHVDIESEFYAESRFALIKALLNDGQYVDGEHVLVDFIANYPNSVDAWDMYYLLLAEQFRQAEITDRIAERIRIEKSSFRLLPIHFKAIAEFSRPQKVESRLLAVNEHHPHQQSVVAALARVAWLKGERELALSRFKEVLKPEGVSARTAIWASQFFLELREENEAEKVLLQIQNPESLSKYEKAEYWETYARIKLLKGELEAALVDIESSITACSHRAAVYGFKSTILRRLKRNSEAIEANELAVKWGAIEEELTRLVTEIGPNPPPPKTSRRISAVLAEIQQPEAAAAWKQLAESMEQLPGK